MELAVAYAAALNARRRRRSVPIAIGLNPA
jgi:hypothetical protein